MRDNLKLLVNNLIFLGICDFVEKEGRIAISTRTFTALENHKRAAEYIFYGLIKLLDANQCSIIFHSSFPCTDGRKAKEFRNAVFKYLTELKRSSQVLERVIIRRSLLDDCAGERYEDLLLGLSTHVYLSRLRQLTLSLTKFPLSQQICMNSDSTTDDLQVQDLVQTYRLNKLHRQRSFYLDMYRAFARKLASEEAEIREEFNQETNTPTSQACVKEHLIRIRSMTSASDWLDLITPDDMSIEDFFQNLPWTDRSKQATRPEQHRKRDVKREIEESRQRLARYHVSQNASAPAVVEKVRQAASLSRSDSVPAQQRQFSFRRPTYTQYKASHEQLLAALEPGVAVSAIIDPKRLATSLPTPSKIPESLLPRPAAQRTIKRAHDLQRTAMKNRKLEIQNFRGSTTSEYMVQVTPETPKRQESRAQKSTVKTVSRLIEILNGSEADSPDISSPLAQKSALILSSYRGTNRSLEQSFSLWQSPGI